jgi:hypothetical protein
LRELLIEAEAAARGGLPVSVENDCRKAGCQGVSGVHFCQAHVAGA